MLIPQAAVSVRQPRVLHPQVPMAAICGHCFLLARRGSGPQCTALIATSVACAASSLHAAYAHGHARSSAPQQHARRLSAGLAPAFNAPCKNALLVCQRARCTLHAAAALHTTVCSVSACEAHLMKGTRTTAGSLPITSQRMYMPRRSTHRSSA